MHTEVATSDRCPYSIVLIIQWPANVLTEHDPERANVLTEHDPERANVLTEHDPERADVLFEPFVY